MTYLLHRTDINYWWFDASRFGKADVRGNEDDSYDVVLDGNYAPGSLVVLAIYDSRDKAEMYAAYVNGVLHNAQPTGGPREYVLENAREYGASVIVDREKVCWFGGWGLAEEAIYQVMALCGWSVVDITPNSFDSDL